MHFLFILIALLGLAYFGFAKRPFDWFSIAFVSACVYFLPGWLGYSQVRTLNRIPLVTDCYLLLVLVLIGILGAGLWQDRRARHRVRPAPGWLGKLEHPHLATVLTAISLLLLLRVFFISGSALFIPTKGEMVEHFTRWHNLWKTSVVMASVLSFASGRHRLLALNVVHLLFLVFIGSRAHLVLSSLGMVTLAVHRKGPERFALAHYRAVLMLAALAIFTLGYKQIYVMVKKGDSHGARERLLRDDLITRALVETEASQQCTIINDVMMQDFVVGPGHLGQSVIQAFLNPFRPKWQRAPSSFNDKIQKTLYPDRRGGVASSFWAEMWSSLGWPGVIAFLAFFLWTCGLGNRWMAQAPPIAQGVIAAWMPYWAFFVHRNDTTSILSYFLKQFVLLLGLALLIVWTLQFAENHVRRRTGNSAT